MKAEMLALAKKWRKWADAMAYVRQANRVRECATELESLAAQAGAEGGEVAFGPDDVYPVPLTADEQAASGLVAGPEMPGSAKPVRDGRYLRYFEDVDDWAFSEFIEGSWRSDGFFDSDVQDAPWKGGVLRDVMPLLPYLQAYADEFGEESAKSFRDAIEKYAHPTPKPAEPAGVEGMIERIKAAEKRIHDGHSPRRIPADPTDVDLVLAEVRMFLEGKPAPFWLTAAQQEKDNG